MRERVLPLLGGCGHPMAHLVSAERSFALGGGVYAAYLTPAPLSFPPFAPPIPTPANGRPPHVSQFETPPEQIPNK